MSFFSLLFVIIILWSIYKTIAPCVSGSCYTLLNNLLKTQTFSNIITLFNSSSFSIIRADNNGENYAFGVKKDFSPITSGEIDRLFEVAQRNHLHTIILATYTAIPTSSPLFKKVKNYNIEVWDYKKLTALASETSSANSSHSYSVLKTSDTSGDHCKIDTDSFDPIQENSSKVHGLFSGLFDKPNHL